MISARDAMQQAIERAQTGEIETGRLWLDIARELRAGASRDLPADPFGIPDEGCCPDCAQRCRGFCVCHGNVNLPDIHVPADEPAYRRAETEVMERMPQESTPAYEAAGSTLEETRSIPHRIAHPESEEAQTDMRCLSCLLPIIWIPGRGWSHDVPGHPAGCDNAEKVSNDG